MPEEPAPLDEPAAKPADVDDLFKEAPSDTAPAAEPAPKADDVEDLFKEDDKKSAAVDRELQSLFSEPPAANVPASRVVNSPAVTPVEQSNAMRLWTDNTGKFQVKARLVSVGRNHVRLLKESGKFTTVPFDRLSRADLAFVRTHSTTVVASAN